MPKSAGKKPTGPMPQAYAWYALGVLFLVYVLNFIDRQIPSILAQDIKRALSISDAQVGFLYGTAFAIFYVLFGISLGRLADCWHRVRLIALGLCAWSTMTAASAFVASYGQLLAARIGVGVGEASASPAAYSLLGDYFPRERRALALGIYSAGLFVGSGLSLPLGGWVSTSWAHHFQGGTAPFGLVGWQAAFLIVGVPGLLLALWVASLREPPRGITEGAAPSAVSPRAWRIFTEELASIVPPLTLWSVARFPSGLRANLLLLASIAALCGVLIAASGDWLQWCTLGFGAYAVASWIQKIRATDRAAYALIWRTPAVLYAMGAFACFTALTYSLSFWNAPYAIRSFGLRADEVGLRLGVPSGFATAAGVILGGRLSDFLRKRSPRGRILACLPSILLPAPIVYAAYATHDVRLFFLLAPLGMMVANMYYASPVSCIQDCLLPRMRAAGCATSFIAPSLGLALGPYLVGRISVSTGSLRLGVLWMLAALPLALFFLWRASLCIAVAEETRHSRAAAAGEPLPAAAPA